MWGGGGGVGKILSSLMVKRKDMVREKRKDKREKIFTFKCG